MSPIFIIKAVSVLISYCFYYMMVTFNLLESLSDLENLNNNWFPTTPSSTSWEIEAL